MKKVLFGLLVVLTITLVYFLVRKNTAVDLPSDSLFEGVSGLRTFIVFGDSGTGSAEQKQLAQQMKIAAPDAVLHTGDVVYPSGSRENYQEKFFDIYQNSFSKNVFYPSPGNHDYQADQLAAYLTTFSLPEMAMLETDNERYYSFDLGTAHFIALDTNTPLIQVTSERSDDMLDWLRTDLEKNKNASWKIVYFHHPPFTSGIQHGEDLRVQKTIVPILEDFDVDVVFSGHEHHYERTCQLKNGICGEQGTTYIITGGGGASLYGFGDLQNYSRVAKSEYHFVVGNISECALELKAISLTGQEIDQHMINKCD